jgi:hypothetical protein
MRRVDTVKRLTLLSLLAVVLATGVLETQETYVNIRLNDDTTTYLQNEQQIVANPTDPLNLVAVWRDFRLGYRRVAYAATTDGGLTWAQALFSGTPYPLDSDPGLTVDTDGTFYAVILAYVSTSEPNGLFVYKSTDGGFTWSGPFEVVDGYPWGFEDKELIACDRSGGPYDGNLYVAWARFASWQEIYVARSDNEGESFHSPVFLENGYLQWPVPIVGIDGKVYVAWIDIWNGLLRFSTSTDGGVSFTSPTTVRNLGWSGYGSINGNIAVFSYPAMAVDESDGPFRGRLYMVYMDHAGSDKDVFLRYSDDGSSWSTPLRVHDDMQGNGRDQFHPWVAVDASGDVAVVWLDRRLDPNNWLWDCYLAISTDGGASFGPNVRVSTVSSDPDDAESSPSERAGLIGEYIGLACANSHPYPLWTDTRNGNQDCYLGLHSDLIRPSIYRVDLDDNHAVLSWYPLPAASSYYAYRGNAPYFEADIAGGTNLVAWGVTDEQPAMPGVQWRDPFPVAETPNLDYYYRVTADIGGEQSQQSAPAGVIDFWLDHPLMED